MCQARAAAPGVCAARGLPLNSGGWRHCARNFSLSALRREGARVDDARGCYSEARCAAPRLHRLRADLYCRPYFSSVFEPLLRLRPGDGIVEDALLCSAAQPQLLAVVRSRLARGSSAAA